MQHIILGIIFFMAFGACLLANDDKTANRRRVVILLGPPGSGKGTQAVRISKELGIPHISTGDLFRENLSKNTELGKKAKSFMEKGQLVPDEIVLDMLFTRVSAPDCANGFLLDGFPRTIAQAEALDKYLGKDANQIALNLEVNDDILVKRISGRLTCAKCAASYNRYFSPPKENMICDKCNSDLTQRTDDTPEVVQERLKVYHAQTKPLIAYYEKKKILNNVDGEKPADDVFKQLMTILKK